MNKEQMFKHIIDLKYKILTLKEEIKEHKQNINSLCDELDDRCNVIDF
jgi:regulator of replication initiation timing